MTPGYLSKRVVADRLAWMNQMVAEIRNLPLADEQAFFADHRNAYTAESCLRRALESLFDLGRHILAKGFGKGVSEYKEIALMLASVGVLSQQDAGLLGILAGYRNRLTHFYHEVTAEELYNICVTQLSDLEQIVGVFRTWVAANPGLFDESL